MNSIATAIAALVPSIVTSLVDLFLEALRKRLGLLPTTESAIAGVTKAIDQLNAVVARENAEIERNRAQMEAARKALVDAAARADRAEVIANRFTALVKE